MSRCLTWRISTNGGASGAVWKLIDSDVNVTSISAARSPRWIASDCMVAVTSAAPAPLAISVSPTRRQRSIVRWTSRDSGMVPMLPGAR